MELKNLVRPLWRRWLRLRRRVSLSLMSGPRIRFTCNICGWHGSAPVSAVSVRETPSCYRCGSTLRFRSIVAALTQELEGSARPLPSMTAKKDVVGIGMSDTSIYADPISRIYSYKNTFYHKEPRLDITDLSDWRADPLDFVITSDVFEHIFFPVDVAFQNLRRLLKSGGVCVFSAPYNIDGATQEHFPYLHKYSIEEEKGMRTLVNLRRDGVTEQFNDLCFHGGDGSTLEMRRFSLPDVLAELTEAGFKSIRVHREDVPDYGIIYGTQDSFIITARA